MKLRKKRKVNLPDYIRPTDLTVPWWNLYGQACSYQIMIYKRQWKYSEASKRFTVFVTFPFGLKGQAHASVKTYSKIPNRMQIPDGPSVTLPTVDVELFPNGTKLFCDAKPAFNIAVIITLEPHPTNLPLDYYPSA